MGFKYMCGRQTKTGRGFAQTLKWGAASLSYTLYGLENVGRQANRQKIIMKLKHIDLEAIWRPFWPHLWELGRPLGAILGVLGPT